MIVASRTTEHCRLVCRVELPGSESQATGTNYSASRISIFNFPATWTTGSKLT